MPDAPDFPAVLPRLLAGVERPGDHCGSGEIELPVVRLEVDGVGLVGLPIAPAQAEALLAVATAAPYGRGPDTIVDPNVRRCGQIAASAVHAEDPRWRAVVDEIVRRAAAALGVEGEVGAELYKLLVYRPGDFFLEHRDTEKAPGMFGTLVVVLPAEHEGGELVVRHGGREATLDLSGADLGVARWAAFYADCEHALRPVRSGYRVALVYNLLLPKGRAPRVPDARPTVARVANALRDWAADPEAVHKVVYPLAHRYSPAQLAFSALKNEDAAVADVLVAAAAEADCVVRLAMVSLQESGSAEALWPPRHWRDMEDEPASYEVVEVHERERTLDGWRRPDDAVEALGALPWEDDEIAPPDALEDLEPDEDHFHEATGNEGCSFERTYRRAALVLWPAARDLAVLNQGGPAAGIAVIERFLDADDRGRAEAMADLVVRDWPRPDPTYAIPEDARIRAHLLATLARPPTAGALVRFLRERVAAGAFEGSDTDALLSALDRVDDDTAAAVLAGVARTCTPYRIAPVARLLKIAHQRGRPFAGALGEAIAALPRVGEPRRWGPNPNPPEARMRGLVDLVAASAADAAAGAALTAAVLQAPAQWPIDGVVLPAVLESGVGGPLREAVLVHLRARLAEPLVPPADATRSTRGLTCGCTRCAALRAFLADPVATTWTLKAAKEQRVHVEKQIEEAGCEVDVRTDKRSNPHALVCTKNRAGYDARARQRARDEDAIRRLGG